jgi:germination protein M
MRKLSMAMVLLVVVGLLSGCSALSLISGQRGMDPIDPNQEPEEFTAVLYFSDDQAMYVWPELRTVVAGEEALPNLLIEELIAGPTEEGLSITIPAETQLLGVLVEDGVAYVDFSQEIVRKHWGGSAGELITIASVVNTLTELPEIDAVQFLIEGEVQESIWGHATTSEPIPRMEEMIGE